MCGRSSIVLLTHLTVLQTFIMRRAWTKLVEREEQEELNFSKPKEFMWIRDINNLTVAESVHAPDHHRQDFYTPKNELAPKLKLTVTER